MDKYRIKRLIIHIIVWIIVIACAFIFAPTAC